MASEGDRAKALLTYANYAKVAAALQVSRTAVAEWAKGQSVTPYRLRQLEQLLRPDLQIEEPPPPEWARAMHAELVEMILANRETVTQALAEETARYGVERALAEQPPAEPAPDKQGPQRERAVRR